MKCLIILDQRLLVLYGSQYHDEDFTSKLCSPNVPRLKCPDSELTERLPVFDILCKLFCCCLQTRMRYIRNRIVFLTFDNTRTYPVITNSCSTVQKWFGHRRTRESWLIFISSWTILKQILFRNVKNFLLPMSWWDDDDDVEQTQHNWKTIRLRDRC